jgi:hypothetical protein
VAHTPQIEEISTNYILNMLGQKIEELFAENVKFNIMFLLRYWHLISLVTPQLEVTTLFDLHHGYHPSLMLPSLETAVLSAGLSVHLL